MKYLEYLHQRTRKILITIINIISKIDVWITIGVLITAIGGIAYLTFFVWFSYNPLDLFTGLIFLCFTFLLLTYGDYREEEG